MRILIDMNLTPRWVESFQAASREAVHCSTLGSATARHREICEYARLHDSLVLTNDLIFRSPRKMLYPTSKLSGTA